jgi:hypothetical protein
MRIFQTLILIVGLSCPPVSDQVNAQLIRITPNGNGGVNIRAPFVRINTDPNGPTHVRAPFVDVNAPPPYYVQPNFNGGYAPANRLPVYGVPNPGQTVVREPGPINTSDVAPSYQPGISAIAPANSPIPAGQPNNAEFRDVPRNTLPTPPGMKSVLEQPADAGSEQQVLRRDLIASANSLQQSLTRYANANVWQDFLKLPEFVRDDSSWVDGSKINQDQWNQLVKTLSRFDKTNGKPEMHLINTLPEFRGTHQVLTKFVQLVQNHVQHDTAELPPPPTPDTDK